MDWLGSGPRVAERSADAHKRPARLSLPLTTPAVTCRMGNLISRNQGASARISDAFVLSADPQGINNARFDLLWQAFQDAALVEAKRQLPAGYRDGVVDACGDDRVAADPGARLFYIVTDLSTLRLTQWQLGTVAPTPVGPPMVRGQVHVAIQCQFVVLSTAPARRATRAEWLSYVYSALTELVNREKAQPGAPWAREDPLMTADLVDLPVPPAPWTTLKLADDQKTTGSLRSDYDHRYVRVSDDVVYADVWTTWQGLAIEQVLRDLPNQFDQVVVDYAGDTKVLVNPAAPTRVVFLNVDWNTIECRQYHNWRCQNEPPPVSDNARYQDVLYRLVLYYTLSTDPPVVVAPTGAEWWQTRVKPALDTAGWQYLGQHTNEIAPPSHY